MQRQSLSSLHRLLFITERFHEVVDRGVRYLRPVSYSHSVPLHEDRAAQNTLKHARDLHSELIYT